MSERGRSHRATLLRKRAAVCGICSLPIPLDVPRPGPHQPNHPLRATIDHIVPQSAGGSNRLENLQLAHARCNEDKGDALPDEFEFSSQGGHKSLQLHPALYPVHPRFTPVVPNLRFFQFRSFEGFTMLTDHTELIFGDRDQAVADATVVALRRSDLLRERPGERVIVAVATEDRTAITSPFYVVVTPKIRPEP